MAGHLLRYGWALARGSIALPLGFALVALPLTMAGAFRPVLVVPGTLAAAAGLVALWGPVEVRVGRRYVFALAVVALGVAMVTALNAQLSAQHVLTERDPGVYTVTARWLAQEHDVLIAASAPAFGGGGDLRHDGYGFYPGRPDGRLYTQFLHLFPAVLAVGDWIGGSWLLTRTNAVIAGFGLFMVFLFAARISGPWWAALTIAALSATLPFAHFARDAYSELLAMAFLWGGLWLLAQARSTFSARRGLVAGLAIGATCMVRIDSFVYLIPLTLYLAWELFRAGRASPGPRRRADRFVAAFAAGAAVSAGLGLLDGVLLTPPYLEDHSGQLLGVAIGLGAALMLAMGGLALRGRRAPRRLVARAPRRAIANGCAAAILALAAFAYFVRPHLGSAVDRSDDWNSDQIAHFQTAEGVPVEGARTYAESSMLWLEWYLGPPALALGVIGMALLVRRCVLGHDRQLLPFLLVLATVAVLYLWRPSIYPDQIWAMRRYLPVVFPGLLILCFWTLRLGWDASIGAQRQRWGRAAIVVLAAAAAVIPAARLGDLAAQRGTQVPLAYVTEQLCGRLPERAAVAVQADDNLDNVYLQTVQVFCRVPVVATQQGLGVDDYRALERRARRTGRELRVLSKGAVPFRPPPPVEKVAHEEYELLEQTLTRRPSYVHVVRFDLFMARVPPAPADGP